MKVYIAYRTETDYEREVIDYLRDFYHQTGKQLERIDPDTREGDAKCKVYDIVEFPTVIAVDEKGVLHNIWRGSPLPLIGEVGYYAE